MKFKSVLDFISRRPGLTTMLLIALIILHGLFSEEFKVDNTTLLLVLFIILLPYIPLLNRIKFGDFEAEIGQKEVERVEEKAKDIPKPETPPSGTRKTDNLEALAETEPTLALAKARIEIEKRVKSLSEIYLERTTANHFSLRRQITNLRKNEIINPSLEALLHDVVAVANQVIHGAFVRQEDAIKLAGYAMRAIEELDRVVVDRALSGKSRPIKPRTVQQYENATYELKTIVPTMEPEMRSYVLNQAELDAFLEGYDEHAEFIVSLEKLKSTAK